MDSFNNLTGKYDRFLELYNRLGVLKHQTITADDFNLWIEATTTWWSEWLGREGDKGGFEEGRGIILKGVLGDDRDTLVNIILFSRC